MQPYIDQMFHMAMTWLVPIMIVAGTLRIVLSRK
jgi:hypothetical protein